MMKRTLMLPFIFGILFVGEIHSIPLLEVMLNRIREHQSEQECHDVAIIGAGIAGSYAAWRLRHSNLRVAVYETSNRIGGRIDSRQFSNIPDVKIELGAMRFHPSEHTTLTKIADDLGLEIIDFIEGLFPSEKRGFYFRNRLLDYNLTSDEFPYNAGSRMDLYDMLNTIFLTRSNYTDDSDPETVATDDGILVKDQSIYELISKYTSTEYVEYVLAVNEGITPASSAVNSLPNQHTVHSDQIKTIQSGMQSFPLLLMTSFLDDNERGILYFNRHLTSITRGSDSMYQLQFQTTITTNGQTHITPQQVNICARKIILTMPIVQLQELDWPPLHTNDIQNRINSMVGISASKIFLAYDYPWWRNATNDISQVVSDTPLRQTFEFGVSQLTGKAILLASYAKNEYSMIWKQLQKNGAVLGSFKDENTVTQNVVFFVHKYLAEIFDMSADSIPAPVDGVMKIWDDNPGWYEPKPGTSESEVVEPLRKPSESDDVFITTNSFSFRGLSSWSEGTLLAVEKTLQEYFSLGAYE